MSVVEQLHDAVVDGAAVEAVAQMKRGLDDGVPAEELLEQGLMAAMRDVGKLFEQGEIFVPEMLVSAHAMKRALELLRPHLVDRDVHAQRQGRDRHGQGRPARHRQEPRRDDAPGLGVRDRGPRR